MVDKQKLNQAINDSGLKRKAIAQRLGLSDHALCNKINGISSFKVSEVLILEDMLHFTEDQTRSIFFNRQVENKSTFERA